MQVYILVYAGEAGYASLVKEGSPSESSTFLVGRYIYKGIGRSCKVNYNVRTYA